MSLLESHEICVCVCVALVYGLSQLGIFLFSSFSLGRFSTHSTTSSFQLTYYLHDIENPACLLITRQAYTPYTTHPYIHMPTRTHADQLSRRSFSSSISMATRQVL